ncbi:polysaccharide deacetylase family protein [Leucobacter sp. CSA1]|uniref:Polysaccharide deacetylase family protein n=1 Tax=Leucobacter chromiisoli TaxID=2796471 RepID=A0A934Q5T0_9MICO|nr:polysaccharide deacetylase family protein [Leucobacter chromiisoli]MBK0417910.1 polysaccharide deacetylase family protein [Leucobacter chromiisoli]
MSWPHGDGCAVVITVDVDGDLPFLAAHPENEHRAKSRSVGRYGPEVGARRVLGVLERCGVRADWFIPGRLAADDPELLREVTRAGHSVGVHGDAHLDFDGLSLDEQLREIAGGAAALAAVTGERPRGFRIPSGEWHPELPRRAAELGFEWSSSLPSDDHPFRTAPGLAEVPWRYELEDAQYFAYNLDPPFPPGQSRITPIETVEANWWCEYEGAARWGTLFVLRLNAELIGTPGRARMLERLIGRIRADGRAEFRSCAEAAAFADLRPGATGEHPYQLFERIRGEELAR